METGGSQTFRKEQVVDSNTMADEDATVLSFKDGTPVLLKKDSALAELRRRVRGKILTPSSGDAFKEACKVWNTMIQNRNPGLIVQCTGTQDVIQCVKFARKHDLMVSVRGGGHNVGGKCLYKGAILIDLSQWRNVRVDPENARAHVSPGAILGDIDHETKEYGLALPIGINATTGISGLTLGGGIGWLSRKYGVTCDSLVSAEVVLYNGKRVWCNESTESDLFWAIRGGGGNFGIVTNFEFQLCNVGPTVMAGPIVFPMEECRIILQKFEKLRPTMPDELSVWPTMRLAPPFPYLPKKYHGKLVLIFMSCYCGEHEDAEDAIHPYRELGSILGDGFGPIPLTSWNCITDSRLVPPARNYWKTLNLKSLSDTVIEECIKAANTVPNFASDFVLVVLGAAINRVPVDKTAYALRDVEITLIIRSRWEEERDDEYFINWVRAFHKAVEPYGSGTSYLNFVSESESNQMHYSANLDKLEQIKAKYDPENFFCRTFNILPTKK